MSFNVIKNSRVTTQGDSEINTQSSETFVTQNRDDKQKSEIYDMESYQNIANNILENARRESQDIISKAYAEAVETKAQAYQEGMEQGHEKAYNEAISGAMQEANKVRAEADSILAKAKVEYDDYLKEKEKHIKELIVNIAQSILKKEVKQEDALNEMIFNTLKMERNIKLYIIKINSSHFEMVKSQVENFKSKLAFQGDIFVIQDEFLDDGTAVVEKETGKSIISIDYGIEKIIEFLCEEQI
ncbi:FliH/SctL family protein [Clostridium lacusfryxellense]|uniref:FliH/SctL family protein n=1 Tax=Clostridium lacusfryxellense TaxID=205328 RepID=UPI001C0B7780|nr:hypothetical protein [Clostridium lacusfryxellense]MBU3111782.1 hypothetical protein [Clostridium lacusfryxellense]